jgi:hypothetical protein
MYYQPFLLPFLGLRRAKTKPGIRRYYYHSFEDGLWDFLVKKEVPKKSYFLIPDFYCLDVVENIRRHGYQVELYPLDDQLQPIEVELQRRVKKFQPKIIFIFHAAGITANLKKWPEKTIIIEDCVHRLVNPSQVKIQNDRHFVMDSLRKVSPLPGSFIYGTQAGLNYSQSTASYFSSYFIKTALWFHLFRLMLCFSESFYLPGLAKFAHLTILKKHDDIIGDRFIPQVGLSWIPWLHSWMNFSKVEKHKQRQVEWYERELKKLWQNPDFYRIHTKPLDKGKLHVYPVGLRFSTPQKADQFTQKLHKKGLPIWAKFLDASWSARHQVLFLPLGFHITERRMMEIKKALIEQRL